ncbi:uncharacterized protein LOC108739906 isoform X2 [Agrilus planipennis]|uniref:Uncharacterized protein LOC108739906 isoform X2 n=1 Tax=Agrilus planipennis TaxID=224129 RepID=A0A1W4X9K5_AGRPL|nr:uncharacterized protein LOC108739906 isoform X2 [Agrilus planipennis]
MSSVKQERQDEAEIQEMATKLMEANRAKMQAALRTAQTPVTAPQNMNILNFLTRNNTNNNNNNGNNKAKNEVSVVTSTAPDSIRTMGDEESARGRFGWTTLGKVHIPYITRSGDKYCAVRMVEMKVLNKYLSFLHQDIYNCTCIRSYYITEVECRLLNEINMKHCDYQFGREQFTLRDLIVRLSDAVEFYNFLDACYSKLLNGSTNPLDRCGFIRINKESVVPYTIYNNQKYVPLFYFEGETENLKLKADKLEGWDLSYLKFCCKVQGIRNELFAHDSCAVISLNDIKNYFPPGTLFEDYWPSKVVDSQLLINGKTQTQMGQWTRQPAAPPASLSRPSPSPKPATQAKAANNSQLQNVQAMYSNYGLTGGQPAYPTPQPRTATSAVRTTYPAAASRQPRPSYYTNMAQAPPPPLIRASQSATTAYSNTQTTVANYMMLGDPVLSQSGYRQSNPQMPKFHPPPLIPVRHLNGGMRYDTPNHYGGTDVVDLSSANSTTGHPIINQQPAHQQPPRGQPATQDDCTGMTNGRMPVNNMHRKLIAIPETPIISGNHIPYKLQKALIENRMVPCFNMKPYSYSDLLVTIPDLIEQLFNSVPVQSCQQVMQVLGIEVYKGNSAQMRLLLENGKCRSIDEVIPLVQVRHVLEYMPQLKYMLGGLVNSELAAKRQRTS